MAALRITRPYTPLCALARPLARPCAPLPLAPTRLPKHSVIIQAGLVICSRRSFFLPLKLPFILLFWPPHRWGAAPTAAARRATTVNRRADRQSRGFCWWGRRTAVAKAFFLSQRRRATLTLAYFTEDNFVGIIIQNEIHMDNCKNVIYISDWSLCTLGVSPSLVSRYCEGYSFWSTWGYWGHYV